MKEALQIASSFVVMSDDFDADIVTVSERLYEQLDATYGDFAGRTLISCHSFEDDWPTWEVHPKGDEFVVLLSGDVDMVLASENSDETLRLSEPGAFVIVPRGIWHTAKVRETATMLFVTPGEGTDNRAKPDRS